MKRQFDTVVDFQKALEFYPVQRNYIGLMESFLFVVYIAFTFMKSIRSGSQLF